VDGQFTPLVQLWLEAERWSGLGPALRGQQISDFPLCNKSFNLSYCGFDL